MPCHSCRGLLAPTVYQVASSSPPPDGSSLCSAARPCREPRWKLVIRCLVAAAERTRSGPSSCALSAAEPGTKFACGTRLGRPAAVTPADVGDSAASAARQPSSTGELQPVAISSSMSSSVWDAPMCCLPRRNQSDSTDSKMGSRCSPTEAAGGTITSSGVAPPGTRAADREPSPNGDSCLSGESESGSVCLPGHQSWSAMAGQIGRAHV